MGGETLLRLLIGVDIVLGPLITLIIFDPRKPQSEMGPGRDRGAAGRCAGVRRLRDVPGASGVQRVQSSTASRSPRRTPSTTHRARKPRPSIGHCRSAGRASWRRGLRPIRRKRFPWRSTPRWAVRTGSTCRTCTFRMRRSPPTWRAWRARCSAWRAGALKRRPPCGRSSHRQGASEATLGYVPARARNRDFAVVVDRATGAIAGYIPANPW